MVSFKFNTTYFYNKAYRKISVILFVLLSIFLLSSCVIFSDIKRGYNASKGKPMEDPTKKIYDFTDRRRPVLNPVAPIKGKGKSKDYNSFVQNDLYGDVNTYDAPAKHSDLVPAEDLYKNNIYIREENISNKSVLFPEEPHDEEPHDEELYDEELHDEEPHDNEKIVLEDLSGKNETKSSDSLALVPASAVAEVKQSEEIKITPKLPETEKKTVEEVKVEKTKSYILSDDNSPSGENTPKLYPFEKKNNEIIVKDDVEHLIKNKEKEKLSKNINKHEKKFTNKQIDKTVIENTNKQTQKDFTKRKPFKNNPVVATDNSLYPMKFRINRSHNSVKHYSAPKVNDYQRKSSSPEYLQKSRYEEVINEE